jgi:uncharacterized DUF497 family protein
MEASAFEWDPKKDTENRTKHGVSFEFAQKAFFDPNRVIFDDLAHSRREVRCFCFGRIVEDVLTVRFTLRTNAVRIIGAGYWRAGRSVYERENQIH